MPLLRTSALREQRETLASLDAVVSALEKVPETEEINIGLNANPFELLFAVLKRCGVTQDELIEWLVRYIKYVLPIIELGVKGVLLANFKRMIDCSVDPRIPAYMRREGVIFDVSQIDMNGLFSISPLDFENNQLYFDVNPNDGVYQFLRGKDFNTFLWYVIHKGKYPLRQTITNYKSSWTEYGGQLTKGTNIFDVTELQFEGDSGIIGGNAFEQEIDGKKLSVFSVCSSVHTKETIQTDAPPQKTFSYARILPVSSDWKKTNYYVNRPTYFNFLDPNGKLDETNPRQYNKDIPICSFEYIDDLTNSSQYRYSRNKLRLTILPKPFVHLPQIGQTLLVPKMVLFNNHGEADPNGRFSLKIISNCDTNIPRILQNNLEVLKEKYLSKNPNEKNEAITYNENAYWDYTIEGGKHLVFDYKGNYWISDSQGGKTKTSTEDILPLLVETYPNLTIYEFNYDYVMSMRLFDAKVVVTQLINELLNFRLGLHFNATSSVIEGNKRITEIVRQIIEAEDYESSDCFFSFSNEQYDKMSREAELKRASLSPFGNGCVSNTTNLTEVNSLLNDFGDAATLEESVDIFKRLINKASGSIVQDETEDYVKNGVHSNIGLDLITQMITQLLSILINSLLSPKLLLLLYVNKELCGQDAVSNIKNISIEELLRTMLGMIREIVKEMRDIFLKDLLTFTLKKLTVMLVLFQGKLVLEQIENYRRIIKLMLKASKFKKRSREIATELDEVDYADIDDPIAQPTTDKC